MFWHKREAPPAADAKQTINQQILITLSSKTRHVGRTYLYSTYPLNLHRAIRDGLFPLKLIYNSTALISSLGFAHPLVNSPIIKFSANELLFLLEL